MNALASPASLKGVLTAGEAAAASARGLRRAGAGAEELPLADGGEGTAAVLGAQVVRLERVHDAFGREREAPVRALADGTAVVESADAIPLDPSRLDVRAASSRGLGELIAARRDRASACSSVSAARPRWTRGPACWRCWTSCRRRRPSCATRARPLVEAPRLFGPQKGALADDVTELERRFADNAQSLAKLPGGGAAGGLGAALASLGAELVPGAAYVLEAIGFRERPRGPTWSSPARARSTEPRSRARRRARSSERVPSWACAACSSAAGSRTASRHSP